MSTTTDPTTTMAHDDYVAVVVNGMSKADRARERSVGDTTVTSSTVGANVKNYQKKIDEGKAPDPRTGDTGASGTVSVDTVAIAEEMLSVVGPALVDRRARINDERAKIAKKIDDAQTALARMDTEEEKIVTAANGVGFDFDAYDTAVEDAQSASTEKETDTE